MTSTKIDIFTQCYDFPINFTRTSIFWIFLQKNCLITLNNAFEIVPTISLVVLINICFEYAVKLKVNVMKMLTLWVFYLPQRKPTLMNMN